MRKVVAILALSIILIGCAPPGKRAQGYVGPQLPQDEVATVFSTVGGRYGNTEICSVDEKSLGSDCASVVYVLSGSRVLEWKFKSERVKGSGKILVEAEAGRIYQLNATPLGGIDGKMRGAAQILPSVPGSKLTYRNVDPNSVPVGVKPDDVLPYGKN